MLAENDKMVKDVRQRLKGIATKGGKYFTGTAKLFLASGTEVVNMSMPTMAGMMDTNRDLIEDTARFLRNPVDSLNRTVDRTLKSDNFQALSKFAKNALSDLKSGDLYVANRDRSEWGANIDSLLDSFGDVDMSGFGDNGEYTEPDIDHTFEKEIKLTEAQERGADARTDATIGAISTATQAMVHTNNANAQTNIRMSLKQHAQMMNAAQNMVTHQAATLQAVNSFATSMLEVNREAHQQVMGQLQTITDLLTQIKTNTTPAAPEKFESPRDDELFGVHGELNIKNWIKTIKRNADEKYGLSSALSMATGGMDLKTILEAAGDNPLQLITDQIVQSVLPTYLKDTMDKTGKYLESFFPALLSKWADRGRNFNRSAEEGGGKFSDFIYGLLGSNVKARHGIDVALRNPAGQAVLTNRTVHSIEQVIPMWLSRIYSAVSGDPLQMYNYSTGRLDKATDIFSKEHHTSNDLVGRMGTAASNFQRRGEAVKFNNPKMDEDFKNYLYLWMQKQAEDNNFIDANKYINNPERFLEEMPDSPHKDMYAKVITSILARMPRHERMAFANEIASARVARNKASASRNNELQQSGLGIIFSGMLDKETEHELEYKTKRKRYGLSDDEREDAVKTAKGRILSQGGVNATNIISNDILNVLKRGIITYTYIIGDNTGSVNSNPLAGNSMFNEALRDAQLVQDTLNHRKEIERNALDRRNEQDAAARRKRQEEIDKIRPLNELIINADTPLETIMAYQEALNLKNTAPGKSDDPKTEATRRLLDQGKDKFKSRFGIDPDKNLFDNIRGFMSEAPFRLMQDGLETMDAFLFKIIYGEDAENALNNTDETPSLMRTVTASVKAHWTEAKSWFSEHIGEPLKDALFNNENGLIPRIRNRLFEKVIDPVKGKAKEIGGRMKSGFIGDAVLDENGNPTGNVQGGKFSDTINRARSKVRGIKDRTSEDTSDFISNFLWGEAADSKRKGVKYVRDRDTQGRFTGGHYEYYGLGGKFKRVEDSFIEMMFGPDANGDDHGSRKKFNMVKEEVNKAFPDMVIGAGAGLIGSLFLPGGPLLGMILGSGTGLVAGSDKLKSFLFGEFGDETEDVMMRDPITGKMKVATDPFTGKKITRKKQVKTGLLDREITDAFKQYAPSVGKGAALGVIGSMFLPGGPILGGVIGAFGGMTMASHQMKELLFGNFEDPKSGLISKEFREKFKKEVKDRAPAALGGAALGAGAWNLISSMGVIPGLSLIPGGPIFGFLGGLTGALNADKINSFFFGDEVDVTEETTDAKGNKVSKTTKKRQGGLFGKAFDFTKDQIITPMANRINKMGESVHSWFDDHVVAPFSRSIEPLKERLHESGERIKDSLYNIGDKIKESFDNVFEKHVGKPLGEFFKEKVITPLENATNKIFSAIGKALGNIISAPFKALEFIVTGKIGDGLPGEDNHQIRGNRRVQEQTERAQKINEARETLGHMTGEVKGFFGKFFSKKPSSDEEVNEEKQNLLSRLKQNGRETWNRIKGGPKPETNIPSDDSNPHPGMRYVRNRDANGRFTGGGRWVPIDNPEYMDAEWRSVKTPKDNHGNQDERVKLRDKEKADRDAKRQKDREQYEKTKTERNTKARTDGEISTKRHKVKRSDNEYLEQIAKHTRDIPKIFSEIKGQLGGSGWNLAYIKTLLDKKFGKLEDDELPEEMEGSKKNVKKRRTIFGKIYDRAADAISDIFSGARDRVNAIIETVFHPFRLLGKAVGAIKDGIVGAAKTIWSVTKTIGSAIGELLKGAAKGLGEIMVGVGKTIKAAGEGVGKALGDILSTLTGVLKDGILGISSVVRGLVETAAAIAPDVAKLAWDGMKFVGKGIGKGIKFAATGVGKGAKWIWNKITGNKDDEGDPDKIKSKIKKIGSFIIEGGYLDEVKGLTPVAIGGDARIPFPYVTVINGLAKRVSNHAIPVYILGVDRTAKFAPVENTGDHNPSENNTPAALPPAMNDNQRTTGAPKVPTVNEDTIARDSNKSSPMSYAKNAARAAADRFRRWKRKYFTADRSAENSSTPAEEYDKMIQSSQTQEEAEAVMAAQQMNANHQLISAGGGDQKGSSGSGILDFLMGKGGILSSIASVGLPFMFHMFSNSGNKAWGLENLGINILRGLGLNKLSPNQIMSALTDSNAAKTIAGEASDKAIGSLTRRGTKEWTKAAKSATRLGKVGEFFRGIFNPDAADQYVKDASGRWRDAATGKFVKKEVAEEAIENASRSTRAGRFIGKGIQNVKNTVSSGIEWLSGTKAGQVIGGLVDSAKTKGDDILTAVKGRAGDVFEAIKTSKAGTKVASAAGKLAEGISSLGKKITGKSAATAIREGAEEAVDTGPVKSAIKKVINSLLANETVKKAFGKLASKMSSVGNKLVSILGGEVLEKAMKSGGKSTLKSTIKQIGAFATGGILAVAFAVLDFTSGMGNARKYFNVYGEDVTLGMRLTAGICNTLGGLLSLIPGVGGLLSVAVSLFMDKIVQAVYGLLSGEDGKVELEKKQNELSAATNAYNAANNTDLTVDEYAKKYNADGTEKKNIFQKAGTAITNGAKNAWSGIKTGASNLINGIFGSGDGLWGTGDSQDLVTHIATVVKSKVASITGLDGNGGIIGKATEIIKNPKQLSEMIMNAGYGIGQSLINMMQDVYKDKSKGPSMFGLIGEGLGNRMIADMKETDGSNATIGSVMTNAIAATSSNQSLWGKVKSGASNLWNKIKTGTSKVWSSFKGLFGNGEGFDEWGTGSVTPMSQKDKRWNRNSQAMAKAGCGPTAAAMVSSAYGARGSTPGEANRASYSMGMRASDGGTNPAFFSQYAASHGYGMSEGPVSSSAMESNLRKGQPVVVMGKGGAYGKNMHYMVADRALGKGSVGLVDPLTGSRKSTSMSSLLGNTKNAIYSFGKGSGELYGADEKSEAESKEDAQIDTSVVYKNNFPFYLQGDARWATKMYSSVGDTSQTMKSSACGPTSAAMILRSYGIPADPPGVADWSLAHGHRTPNNGTAWSLFNALGNEYGLDVKTIPANKIVETLASGVPILASMSKGHFTTGGHFIDLVGTVDGKVLVNDPASTKRTEQIWDPAIFANEGKNFWTFTKDGKGSIGNLQSLDLSQRTMVGGTTAANNTMTSTSGSTGATSNGVQSIEGMDMMSAIGSVFSGMSSKLDDVMTILMGGTIASASSNNTEGTNTMQTSGGTNHSFGASAGTMDPSESAKSIWEFLQKEGYTPEGAAGLMGCWQNESGNRADRVEGDYLKSFPGFNAALASNTALNDWTQRLFSAYANSGISINKSAYYGSDGNLYPGIGLAQWTGSRGYNLFKYAKDNGLDWRDLNTQLGFFKQETNTTYTNLKSKLNQATSPEHGAQIGLDNFEMYDGWSSTSKGQEQLAVRAKSAAQIYNTYANSTGSITGMGSGWGRGTADLSDNTERMMEHIRSINRMMDKTREEAQSDNTVATITEKITDAIGGASRSGGDESGEYNDALQIIAGSLATMVDLLTKISKNTEKANDATAASINAKSSLPTVSPHYPNGERQPEDIGALTINRLTSI